MVRLEILAAFGMKRLTIIGGCISAAWVIAFVALLSWKAEQAMTMNLNEWGDFLAGLSAPLALIWFVIGYFQQGEELRLNTDALKAQQEELHRQVEETIVLARNAERQASAAEMLAVLTKTEQDQQALRERADAQPRFIPATDSRHSPTGIYTGIRNAGGDAIEVRLECREEFEIELKAPRVWQSGRDATILIKQQPDQLRYPFRFRLQYNDKFGDFYTKTFEYCGLFDFRELHDSKE